MLLPLRQSCLLFELNPQVVMGDWWQQPRNSYPLGLWVYNVK